MSAVVKKKFISVAASIAELPAKKIMLNDSPYNSNLDSLRLIELLVKLESEFDIEFEDEELAIGNYETLNDLYLLLESKTEATNGKKD